MCGIAALHAADVTRTDLERMNACLHHRGPDDGHLFIGQGIGLAARRLSIIDLEHGRQPLSNEDGTVWITYNGEVFNAPALRTELQTAGHIFQTAADTEVIVHAYEEWGTGAVAKLRGMFAFAVWDVVRRRLMLARDRFGMKPLYYAQLNGRFACASEIKPLFAALPPLPRRANHEALHHLFEVGYIPAPQTAFAQVWSLPAAHLLILDEGQAPLIRPYWQLQYTADKTSSPLDFAETTEAFMAQLRAAVDAWRMSDVPVGSLLSGGIDSSTLAALLTEISSDPIHTFTISFAAASHDEAAVARTTAAHIGSQHHELRFEDHAFDYLPQVIRHLESPQCSATSVAVYLLYQACRAAGFKVIMTGEGADELLGGYHWFDGDRRVRPLLKLPRPLRKALAKLPLPVSTAGKRVLAQGNGEPVSRYLLWQQVATPAQQGQLFTPNGPVVPLTTQWPLLYGERLAAYAPLHQFLFLETQTRLTDFINFEVDRLSMANSVEARPPFLDHELWEFCAQLPPQFKLTAAGNKHLLRCGVQDLLPELVATRPKKGLATPHAAWWRQSRLPAWAEDVLQLQTLQTTGYFQAAYVQQLRREHQRGTADHSRLLTGILTTQLWHGEMQVV